MKSLSNISKLAKITKSTKNYISNKPFNFNFFSSIKFSKFSNKNSLINFPKKNFSGCGSSNCSSNNNNCDSNKDEIEKNLQALNQRLIQCINLGEFDDALDLSEEYQSQVKSHFGK